jgi:ADP-ribose pyrophosphatase YjhB (NUDIX family)
MNFCSKCGSSEMVFRVPEGDTFSRWLCGSCGTVHYQNPNIITGGICLWQSKIMLARRGIEPRKGFWNLPCGFLELNETVEQGAIREIKEETNIDVALGRLHTVYNLPHANQVYLIFVAKMLHANFATNAESTEIALFTASEIPWSEIAFSSNTFAIERFLDDLHTGNTAVHLGTFTKNLPY